MKHTLLAACAAFYAAVSPVLALAAEHEMPGPAGHPETVRPLFKHSMPNVPGKALVAVEVTFPPGAAAAPHMHPKSAFVYAYVLSGQIVSAVDHAQPRVYQAGESWYEEPGAHHPVTSNPSKDKPAKLLAIFIVDPAEKQLVLPEAEQP